MNAPISKLFACMLLLFSVFDISLAQDIIESNLDSEKSAEKIGSLTNRAFVKAEFINRRYLKILSRPIETHGYVLFAKEKGLVWKTTQPIESTLLMNKDGVRQLDRDGQSIVNNNAQSPVFAGITQGFIAIFSDDRASIAKYFNVSEGQNEHQLILGLKDEQFKALFTNIRIDVTTFLQRIVIQDVSGDRTDIEFRNALMSADKLTGDDKKLLEML